MRDELIIMHRELPTLDSLKGAMEEVAKILHPQTLLLFTGDLGSGKTTAIITLLKILGVDIHTGGSPSFALHNHYVSSSGLNIEHLDLYRIEDEDDLESSGFWDLFATSEPSVITVEWANRLNWDYLLRTWQTFHIHFTKGGMTSIEDLRMLVVYELV